MKAVRIHKKGGPEQLIFEDAPIPQLRPGDALVRVHALSITPTELTWSTTYTSKDGSSRLPTIPGHDLSGTIESLAPGTNTVKPGEAVYALTDFWRDGTAAEYVAVRAEDLAPKPRTLDFEQAASVPLSCLTAWQALFHHAGLSRGRSVLIHGGAGGVGSFAVQLAHWRGARVIATGSKSNMKFLSGLGADEVIDHNAVRFEDKVHNLDVVLDNVGGDTLARSWGVLRMGGALVTIVGDAPAETAAKYRVRGVSFIVEPNRAQLIEIGNLVDEGSIRPVIANVYPIQQVRKAFEQSAGGHTRGKIVLRIQD